MKLVFVLIAALFVARAASQYQNINLEAQNLLNELDSSANSFINTFTSALQSISNLGAAFLQTGVNLLNAALQAFGFLSPTYVQLVNVSLNTTVQSLAADLNAGWVSIVANEYFQLARSSFVTRLSQFVATLNTTAGIYDCWNASRPLIRQVFRDFVNNTNNQIQPKIADYRNVSNLAYNAANSNFSYYSNNVPLCITWWNWWNVAAIRNCREQYWAANAPAVRAAFDSFRTTVINKRNETVQALQTIVSNNAQIARDQLSAIDLAFRTCVNNTLTTTAAPAAI